MEAEAAINEAIKQHLLYLADDELILAHRDSEWTGHAPILEEDIAFANIAQDELGHASLWYELLEKISGDRPNDLVFFRNADAFRNCQLFELPNSDWARSMMRQFLFDAYELVRASWLTQSKYDPIAHAAAKIKQEEIYHYRHTSNWVRRLGWGTKESNQRMQASLIFLWPFAYQLFVQTPEEELLVDVGYIPSLDRMKEEWEGLVIPFLEQSDLQVPKDLKPITTPRNEHTVHLHDLVTDLQEVARTNHQAQW